MRPKGSFLGIIILGGDLREDLFIFSAVYPSTEH